MFGLTFQILSLYITLCDGKHNNVKRKVI